MDWDLQTGSLDVLIVDGLITNELKPHYVKLSKPSSQLNAPIMWVSGAQVSVSDGDTSYVFNETLDSAGLYLSDSTFSAVIGKEYKLTILFNNKTYTALTSMVPVTPFESLTYREYDDHVYKIDSISRTYNSEDYAMWEIMIDWSHLPQFDTIINDTSKARLLYYTLPTIDINQMFSPVKENVYFPLGAIITERKYSLTYEHSLFIRSLMCETNWRGGYFDVAHANVITNLSEGAMGYFGACTVDELEIVVD